MDPDLAVINKTYSIAWEILLEKLLLTLNRMKINSGIWGGMEYGFRKNSDSSPFFKNYEVFPGFEYTDQKVVLFAEKAIPLRRAKYISIVLYHNIHGKTLLRISESDPGLTYGYQKLIAHPRYINLIENIFRKLEQEI